MFSFTIDYKEYQWNYNSTGLRVISDIIVGTRKFSGPNQSLVPTQRLVYFFLVLICATLILNWYCTYVTTRRHHAEGKLVSFLRFLVPKFYFFFCCNCAKLEFSSSLLFIPVLHCSLFVITSGDSAVILCFPLNINGTKLVPKIVAGVLIGLKLSVAGIIYIFQYDFSRESRNPFSRYLPRVELLFFVAVRFFGFTNISIL